jgi:hypothetical protein
MIRGLLWLPLLLFFFWLAWAGWNEYQKVEAYRHWAEPFERTKYDIYAVLGQKGTELTWGKPTRKGPIDLQTFSLDQVQSIELKQGDRTIPLDQALDSSNAGNSRKSVLSFQLSDQTISIPFTELSLAIQWGKFLQSYHSELTNTAQGM